jgi:hypothetical protein
MGKAHRSPLLGYNHNVGHLGRVFHVQTEDSGPSTPRLFTHLFHEGTILVSRRVDYEASLPDDKVRVLMQTQHRTVIKDLAAGTFNERIQVFFRARGIEVTLPVPAPAALPSVATPEAAPAKSSVAREPAHAAAPTAAVPATIAAVPTPAPMLASPPRRSTRPIETGRPRKPTPPPVTVRPPDSRRPPFVRNAQQVVAKTASADGVVVQRSVVVGGISTGDGGRSRIRPPVPYIVTGGTHPVRPVTAPAPIRGIDTNVPVSGLASASGAPAALGATDGAGRAASAFGPPVPDDKSLDEVILEYLSDDGD